ncbi:nitrilase family protein [Muricauda sp. JGD-17]|uniref:Omega-amidase YafV n=1 Tax=Flagellimonas ochracea TaxID=2696472 RepID=A0A964TD20_9FLAO|nr:nitrilase family protein [Allomuricauda ochracea]NAY91911.1 nitrilase family protein [Allomuricauda ochracea]
MERKLNIALIQTKLHWEDPDANKAMFEEKMVDISSDVDLIVLPEMFSTGFTMFPNGLGPSEGKRTLEWMQQMALKKDTAILGSTVFMEGNKNYNRLFFVYPNGEFKSYDKRHTFTLAGENKVYESGSEKVIVDYEGFKICPLICYDLRFPVWARNVEDYDVLIYVANWPKPRIAAWDVLLKARAIENMCYCVGVNRTGLDESGYQYPGHSAVYDALGGQLVYSEKEEVLYALLDKESLEKTRNKLRFLDDRDVFILK